MLKKIRKSKVTKVLSVLLGLSFLNQIFLPNAVFALTSGPSQPEVQSFEPIGTTDMVDVFSGDFTYNIPLMQVGDYPLNLAYHAGVGMDDESSYVGLGWNMNPGVINRTLRGIPDDFKGDDRISFEKNIKPNITIDIGGGFYPEFFGIGFQFGGGIKYNNYRGISTSTDFGVTVGPMSMNMSFDSEAGLDYGLSFSSYDKEKGKSTNPKASVGVQMNSREGLKSLSFSYSETNYEGEGENRKVSSKGSTGASISFARPEYVTSVSPNFGTYGGSLMLRIGGEAYGVAPQGYVSVGFHVNTILDKSYSHQAIGYLYANEGGDKAMRDFSRDKESTLSKETKYLHTTNNTYDLFSVSGHGTGGQYRFYRSNVGIMTDPKVGNFSNHSVNISGTIDVGVGGLAKGGGDVYVTLSESSSKPWTSTFGPYNHLQFDGSVAAFDDYEPVYMKSVGEKVPVDQTYFDNLGGDKAMKVPLTSNHVSGASSNFRTYDGTNISINGPVRRTERDKRNSYISYHTADIASVAGVDKYLRFYDYNEVTGTISQAVLPRVGDHRKEHHVSEIIVTNPDGSRYVYGIPAYNLSQHEYLYATESTPTDGFVNYNATDASRSNSRGIDNFFEKKSIDPYVHSYLLTAILGPDYVDVNDNGVDDEDLGTFTKLNYLRMHDDYQWRTPASTKSNFMEGFKSDSRDDKASFVYGTKEVWYLYSVENRTHIAEMDLDLTGRSDSRDVAGVGGGIGSKKLAKLDNITLFSKADLNENGANASPIKTAHFGYSNSLCNSVPNASSGGKLTLDTLYFTYGTNSAGSLNSYQFTYYDDYVNANQQTVNFDYDMHKKDRWGGYMDPHSGMSEVSEFPYVNQDADLSDQYASAWNLKTIKLPSGGEITVNYESDDYAYVQDKKAMSMVKLLGFGKDPTLPSNPGQLFSGGGSDHRFYALIDVPTGITTLAELEELFKDDVGQFYKYLYFNCLVKLAGWHDEPNPPTNPNNHWSYDRVSGYMEVLDVGFDPNNSNRAWIKVKPGRKGNGTNPNKEVNPVALAAWKFSRYYRPQIAYESPNANVSQNGLKEFAEMMVAMFSSMGQIFAGIHGFMAAHEHAKFFEPDQSWLRINALDNKKLGGGHRVQKISFDDNWYEMTGNVESSRTYGQEYQYGDENGSWGVASYEPHLGGDENPLRVPFDSYNINHIGGPSDDFYIEGPLGESLYPSPSVGYSKVSVSNLKPVGYTTPGTGKIVHEFYTAKDFPVYSRATGLDRGMFRSADSFLSFISVFTVDYAEFSQGFSVVVNDMHGKPKSKAVFAEGDNSVPISKETYHYKTQSNNPKKLDNNVPVLNKNGTYSTRAIGREMEVAIDNKRIEDFTSTTGFQFNCDGFLLGFIPLVVPSFFPTITNHDKMLRVASVTKVVNEFGIMTAVTKEVNGAAITTNNMLWDEETGEVLLTQTQNEFGDELYDLNYPAHFAYDQMGPAYQNSKIVGSISVSPAGIYQAGSQSDFDWFTKGDEVLLQDGNGDYTKAWVLDKNDGNNKISLIDKVGEKIPTGSYSFVIHRSGKRNQQGTSVGAVTSREAPIVGSALSVSNSKKIVNASAVEYTDNWQTYGQIGNKLSTYVSCEYTTESGDSLISLLNEHLNHFDEGYYTTQNNEFMESSEYELCDFDSIRVIAPSSTAPAYPSLSISFTAHYNCGLPIVEHCRFLFRTLDGSDIAWSDVTSFDGTVVFDESIQGWELLYNTGYFVTANTASGPVVLEFLTNSSSCTTTYTVECEEIEEEECTWCGDSLAVNPYLNNVRGIWRPKKSYAYHHSREYAYNGVSGNTTNSRFDGDFTNFTAFWSPNSGNDWQVPSFLSQDTSRWVWTSEVTKIHPKGMEIENKDALGRYSSALYGYWGSVPTAVASNSEYKQIAFDCFEDYDFQTTLNPHTCVLLKDHWNFRTGNPACDEDLNIGDFSHTGYRALKIPGGQYQSVTRIITDDSYQSHPSFIEEFFLKNQDVMGLFAPDTGEYVFGAWVLDNSTIPVYSDVEFEIEFMDISETVLSSYTVTFDGESDDEPVIELWKRVEDRFTVPSNAAFITVTITNIGSSDFYIDDIRMHPVKGNMKSFVYDRYNLRLMAELDENNYATLYEYDEEGNLIRVKKETERGIMTLKEHRQNLMYD